MGTYLSKSQEEISQSLKEEYVVEVQPYLLHKRTQQLCTLHKITTNSLAEVETITQIIEEYERSKCESISKLRTHYHIDNKGYCSDEESFYLVFDGQNNYTLREQFVKRRLYRTQFSDQEIEQIVETFLCGLREYDHRFQRDYTQLSLDSIVIDQKSKKITLKDPWLASAQSSDHTDAITSLLLQYPSPEKLRTAMSSKLEDFKEVLSNLFSIGVMALELNRLEFADGIYTRKKEVNYDEIKLRLGQFKGERLRKGIQCLLNPIPTERKKIYQIWGIENREEHYLERLLAQNEEIPIAKIQGKVEKFRSSQPQQTSVQSSKFRFPSTSIPPQQQQPQQQPQPQKLTKVPSEAIFTLPPLNIQNHVSSPQAISTKRSNPQERGSSHTRPPTIVQSNFIPTIVSKANQAIIRPSSQNSKPIQHQHTISINFGDTKRVVVPQKTPFQIAPSIPAPSDKQLNFNDYLARQEKKYPQVAPVVNQSVSYPANTNILSTYQSPNPNKPSQVTSKTLETNSLAKPSEEPKSVNVLINPVTMQKETINQPVVKLSTEVRKSQDQQANIDSLVRQRTVTSIYIDSNPLIPTFLQKDPSIIDQLHSPQFKVESAPLHSQESSFSNNHIKTHDYQINSYEVARENNNDSIENFKDQDSSNTPQKPTGKNKYNSTIVEVKDEDTPDHSRGSESHEAIEEEFVVQEYETGSRYQGFKSNGMRNGRGKFYYQDGGFYEGQWKNNKMDGYGKLYYQGGKLAYEGNWSQDEFNGFGKVYNDNPVHLQEPFDYTNFELLEDYWEFYEGTLQHDTKEGLGKIKLSNGERFEGDFHQDRIQGLGKFYTMDGRIVQAIWRESRLIKVINNSQ